VCKRLDKEDVVVLLGLGAKHRIKDIEKNYGY
jgi:hypothetical protein